MSAILYGNLRVEIVSYRGARVDRLSLWDAPPTPIRRPFRAPDSGLMLLGRDEQISAAYAAARSQHPIEFTAACGYGKSTLLRHVAVNAARDGVARSSVYLQAGPDGLGDLLQRLVAELYTSDPPVKPTAEQCTQLLGQVRAMIVLDDVTLDPGQVEYLLRVLPGCSLVLASRRPVLGRHGTSYILAGLPSSSAVELITSELGRQLTGTELAAAGHLVAAVDGQPLHLRQAAALVRENGLSFERLARTAERDPEELDRLSVNALAGQERRALAVLALAAGALLPADLVGAMGDIAEIGQSLGLLHRRGLAEQHADRFGLPVCKVDGYRQMLLKDLQLAAALREFVGWLAERDPTTADSLSAAGAALGIIEWAAELGDWPAVVRLVRVAEPILTLAGRWEASSHILDQGLEAAKATGDRAAEALFSHEQGSLALCRDDLDAARQLLEHALELRERIGDDAGAEVTRHNLQLLQPPPAPPMKSGRSRRRLLVPAGTIVLVLIALGAGVAKAISSGSPSTVTVSPTQVITGTTSPASQPTDGNSATPGGGGSATPGGGGSATPGGGGSATPDGGGGSSPPLQPPAVQAADFDPVDITPGQAPASQDIAIRNPNTQPIEITGVQASAPFSIATDTCSNVPIQGQASCSITVHFEPTTLGTSTGTLTVNFAAGQSTTQLSGTGFAELTIDITPVVGTVQSDSGFSCNQAECIEQITGPVTLTATPKAFKGWKGPCSGQVGCGPLNLTEDTTVTAVY
jgi:hypothetical protein